MISMRLLEAKPGSTAVISRPFCLRDARFSGVWPISCRWVDRLARICPEGLRVARQFPRVVAGARSREQRRAIDQIVLRLVHERPWLVCPLDFLLRQMNMCGALWAKQKAGSIKPEKICSELNLNEQRLHSKKFTNVGTVLRQSTSDIW